MENKSNCSKIVVLGIVLIVASIFLSPIVYGEYRYRKCIELAADLTANSQALKEFKNMFDYDAALKLQCYAAAFGEK
jgi:hypothetical protein